jgi:replicative DNA helicase
MPFPFYIQKAVDLGLLEADGDRITGCRKEEVETVLGVSRIIEKIQPTTAAEKDDTQDQEAIVLCRILTSPSGKARELWADLRCAVGIGHGQELPQQLWSCDSFRAIGTQIDAIYNGTANGASIINSQTLIESFAHSPTISVLEFNQSVTNLSQTATMRTYGDPESEWDVAIDLLRQARARATFKDAQHLGGQAMKSDTKLEKAIEAQQQELMTCLGMLRGSVGSQGNAVDAVEDLISPKDGRVSLIDQIMNAREQVPPVSTGMAALDIDMEGGVRLPGQSAGGRLFTLAARTGVGKTVLGVFAAINLARQGLEVGFVSAELDKAAIYARIWSAATHQCNPNTNWAEVGDIDSPSGNREVVSENLMMAAGAIQQAGGKLLIEDPWGACVDAVINSMRSMKAKNPNLRAVVIDHFHCLARHKGAPTNDSGMMEERAYKLMNAAKELEIDLIVLAQMNRVGMDSLSQKESPKLDQIRGTDALSHVSHAVWIVRKEMEGNGEERKWTGNLELWHSKTRGRQAMWKGNKITGLKQFVDKSILSMDYKYSSVKADYTNSSEGSSSSW